jgi:Gpi18-like mannosyltransferase
LLKVLPVACELALIAAAYLWLIERPSGRIAMPLALAVCPGFCAISGWWGQYEPVYMVFIVLGLLALSRERPILAWGLFGVSLMVKQPALVAAPVFLVLTLRRYGWRTTLHGAAICGGVCAAVAAPFLRQTGADVLSSYVRLGDVFPFLTNNAHNFWYGMAAVRKGRVLEFFEDQNSEILLGGVTMQHAGVLLFAALVLLVVVAMWRRPHDKQEFLWAAALFFGFFMLPTEVHERYLYPAAVLILFAAAQRPRVWIVAAGTAITLSFNVYAVAPPTLWDVAIFRSFGWILTITLLNTLLFATTIRFVAMPRRKVPSARLSRAISYTAFTAL